jgi:hypothetical protein
MKTNPALIGFEPNVTAKEAAAHFDALQKSSCRSGNRLSRSTRTSKRTGRLGLTAVGNTQEEAESIYAQAKKAMDEEAAWMSAHRRGSLLSDPRPNFLQLRRELSRRRRR